MSPHHTREQKSEPRSATITHTASVQYHSNSQSKRKLPEGVDPIVNLSPQQDRTIQPSQDKSYQNDQISQSNQIHEGISYMQKNLNSLEGKYKDLANFYNYERPLSSGSQTEIKLKKSTPRQVSNDSKKPLLIEENKMRSINNYVDEQKFMQEIMDSKKQPTIENIIQKYKQKLELNNLQSKIYENLQKELNQLYQDDYIETEQNEVEKKGMLFEIKHLADQIQIDLKRALTIRSDEINKLLSHSREKIEKQKLLIAQYIQINDSPLFQKPQEYTYKEEQIQILEDHIKQLQNKNKELQLTIDAKSTIKSNNSTNFETLQLANLATRFLNSMRSLQKAVHKREQNVSQQKSDFESTKKELEQYIKQLNKTGYLNDLSISENTPKQSVQSPKDTNQTTQLQSELKLKNEQILKIKEQVELCNKQSQEWAFNTYRIETLADRLKTVTKSHLQLKKIIQMLNSQINLQEQTLKTKNKEIEVLKCELTSTKAETKEKIKKISFDYEITKQQAVNVQSQTSNEINQLKFENQKLQEAFQLQKDEIIQCEDSLRVQIDCNLKEIKLKSLIDLHRVQKSQNAIEHERQIQKNQKLKNSLTNLKQEHQNVLKQLVQKDDDYFDKDLYYSMADEQKKLLEKYQNLVLERDADKKQVQQLQKENEVLQELENQNKSLMQQHGDLVQEARQKLSEQQSKLECIKKEKEKDSKEVQELTNALSMLKSTYQQKVQELETCQNILKEMQFQQEDLGKVEQEFAQLKEQSSVYRTTIESKDLQLQTKELKLNNLQTQNIALQQQLQIQNQNNEIFEEQLQQLQESAVQQAEQHEIEIQEMQEQLQFESQKIKEYQNQQTELDILCDQYVNKLQSAFDQIQLYKQEQLNIKQNLKSFKDTLQQMKLQISKENLYNKSIIDSFLSQLQQLNQVNQKEETTALESKFKNLFQQHQNDQKLLTEKQIEVDFIQNQYKVDILQLTQTFEIEKNSVSNKHIQELDSIVQQHAETISTKDQNLKELQALYEKLSTQFEQQNQYIDQLQSKILQSNDNTNQNKELKQKLDKQKLKLQNQIQKNKEEQVQLQKEIQTLSIYKEQLFKTSEQLVTAQQEIELTRNSSKDQEKKLQQFQEQIQEIQKQSEELVSILTLENQELNEKLQTQQTEELQNENVKQNNIWQKQLQTKDQELIILQTEWTEEQESLKKDISILKTELEAKNNEISKLKTDWQEQQQKKEYELISLKTEWSVKLQSKEKDIIRYNTEWAEYKQSKDKELLKLKQELTNEQETNKQNEAKQIQRLQNETEILQNESTFQQKIKNDEIKKLIEVNEQLKNELQEQMKQNLIINSDVLKQQVQSQISESEAIKNEEIKLNEQLQSELTQAKEQLSQVNEDLLKCKQDTQLELISKDQIIQELQKSVNEIKQSTQNKIDSQDVLIADYQSNQHKEYELQEKMSDLVILLNTLTQQNEELHQKVESLQVEIKQLQISKSEIIVKTNCLQDEVVQLQILNSKFKTEQFDASFAQIQTQQKLKEIIETFTQEEIEDDNIDRYLEVLETEIDYQNKSQNQQLYEMTTCRDSIQESFKLSQLACVALETEHLKLKQEYTQTKDFLKEHQKRIIILEAEKMKIEEQLRQQQFSASQVIQKFQDIAESLQTDSQQIKNENIQLTQMCNLLQSQISQFSTQINQKQSQCDEFEVKNQNLLTQIKDQKLIILECEQQLKQSQKENADTYQKYKEFQAENKTQKDNLRQMNDEAIKLQKQIQNQDSLIASSNQKIKNYDQEILSLRERIQESDQEHHNKYELLDQKNNTLMQQQAEFEKAIFDASKEIDSLIEKLISTEQELDQVKSELEDCKKELNQESNPQFHSNNSFDMDQPQRIVSARNFEGDDFESGSEQDEPNQFYKDLRVKVGDQQELPKEQKFIDENEEEDYQDIVEGLQDSPQKQEIRLRIEIEQLKELLESAQKEIQILKEKVHDDDDDHLIEHVKGTLMQFLKLTPYSDQKNEELLKIIFSMMKVTKEEQTELMASRMMLKTGNKLGIMLEKQNSKNNVSSNQSNTSGGNTSQEKKKGLFGGMFGKSNKDIVSPQPIPRPK